MKIEIRNAKKEDELLILKGIKEICKLEKEKPDSIAHLKKQFNHSLKRKEIIVTTINNKAVGFIWFLIASRVPYGVNYGKQKKYCWLDWFYVLKEYRNKGIGTILLKELVKHCKKIKINEIITDVYNINKKSLQFHEKRGFKPRIEICEERIK
jgi:phosphinothricin acetyltransferase